MDGDIRELQVVEIRCPLLMQIVVMGSKYYRYFALFMKTTLLTFCLLISGVFAFASPSKGGQIFWKALGNNQYIFHLEILQDCSVPPPAFDTIHSTGSTPTFQVAFSSSRKMSPNCTNCGNGEVVIWEFISNTITINPPSASSFIEFYAVDCCRDTLVNVPVLSDHVIRSVMYRPGANRDSPYFDFLNQYYAQAEEVVNLEAYSPNFDSISIAYDLPRVMLNGAVSVAPFNPGYSSTHPTSGTDTLLYYGIFHSGTADTGTFLLNFKVEEYDAGVLTSSVGLETTLSNDSLKINNSPNLYGIQGKGNWVVEDSVYFHVRTSVGDTVSVEFIGSDFDYDANLNPQWITADMNSLDYPAGVSVPSLSPIAPQTGLFSTYFNEVRFEWVIDATVTEGWHRFIIRFEDDDCPSPGVDFGVVEVFVSNIHLRTVKLCEGESAVLTSIDSGASYLWTPSTGLSATNTSSVTANPTTSTVYSLYVDGVLSAEFDVQVTSFDVPNLTRVQPNSILLTNTSKFQEVDFLHFYVPIQLDTSSILATEGGFYHAFVRSGECVDLSDSIVITNDTLQDKWIVDKPMWRGDTVVFAGQSSYTMGVSVGSFANLFAVKEILIPGAILGNSLDKVTLTAVDYSGITHGANAFVVDGQSLKFVFPTPINLLNGSLTLNMTSTGIRIPVLMNQFLPFQFGDIRVSSTNSNYSGPALTDDIIPFVFRGYRTIGVEEISKNIQFYPNPANFELRVAGLDEGANFRIIDLSGRELMKGALSVNGSISTSALKDGVYIIQLEIGDAYFQERFIVQH